MNLLKMVENGGRKRRSGPDLSPYDDIEGGIGCGWGVFHINKHYQWPHFLRRIAHHRRKRLVGIGAHEASFNGTQERDKLIDGERATESSHGHNGSIKSWMKSLVTEEFSKIKGRHHHRTSLKRNKTSSASMDEILPEELTGHGSSGADYLTREESPENMDGFEAIMNRKLVFTNQKSADSFTNNPKDYLDALNIISANEEFLVKALHDPGSPLARHFSNQQALNSKRSLAKCDTFPLFGVSDSPKKIQRAKSEVSELIESSLNRKKHGETGIKTKRCKNLRQKIKHMIRDSKNERRRVAMDAIIHKIPHDQKIEIDTDRFDSFETGLDQVNKESPSFKQSKSRLRKMTRASSLNESLDRYQRLYETSFKHEVSSERVQRLKTVPNNLSRIYSLPDMRSYLSPKGEYSDEYFSGIVTRRNSDEQTCEDLPLRSNAMESINEEEEDDRNELRSINSVTENELSAIESATENEAVLTSTESNEDSIQSRSPMNESKDPGLLINEQARNGSVEPEPGQETENLEATPSKLLTSHVSTLENFENEAEFSYVKDILELSGFSSDDGLLGTWHSDDQPLDPAMHEETEGSLVFEPLLFDLINEALMEIYGRSYSYYPFPLSTLSRRSPMPIGQNVLKHVWELMILYLSLRSEVDQPVDLIVGSDVAKSSWWMNLQFDCECVGLELEDLIFQDLLQEIVP